ncbi:hypothetical protein PGB90_009556 [Kerria lacca]
MSRQIPSNSEDENQELPLDLHRRQRTRLAKTIAKNRIRNLSVVSPLDSKFPTNMTTTPIVGPIFKKPSDITRLIRHEFSGRPDELQAFLDDYNLANMYCPPDMVHNLFIEIVAHITKAARSDLQGRSDLKTWEKLRDYLKKKYKYHYTFNQLCEQLS